MYNGMSHEQEQQELHKLADSVAKLTGIGMEFLPAFGQAFPGSELYDTENLNLVRIQVGSILRARREKHPPKQPVVSNSDIVALQQATYPD